MAYQIVKQRNLSFFTAKSPDLQMDF